MRVQISMTEWHMSGIALWDTQVYYAGYSMFTGVTMVSLNLKWSHDLLKSKYKQLTRGSAKKVQGADKCL